MHRSLSHDNTLDQAKELDKLPRGTSNPANGGKRVEGKWSELQTVQEGIITVKLEAEMEVEKVGGSKIPDK
jgi:hypothetical protein